jgi:hypothetical protein
MADRTRAAFLAENGRLAVECAVALPPSRLLGEHAPATEARLLPGKFG